METAHDRYEQLCPWQNNKFIAARRSLERGVDVDGLQPELRISVGQCAAQVGPRGLQAHGKHLHTAQARPAHDRERQQWRLVVDSARGLWR